MVMILMVVMMKMMRMCVLERENFADAILIHLDIL